MRNRMMLIVAVTGVLVVAALIGGIASSSGATPGSAVRVATRSTGDPVGTTGETFLKPVFTINYTGGTVLVAGNPAGTAQIDVDDALRITIKHQDGTTASYYHDFSANCTNSSDVPINPVILSSRLKLGVNTITFAFMDKCGGVEGRWETWLTMP